MNKLLEIKRLFHGYYVNIFVRIYLCIQSITRFALCILAITRNQINPADIPTIMLYGLVADIISSTFILPIIVLLQQCNVRYISGFFRGMFALLCSIILIFSAVSQVGFWDEFSTNFNFIAVDYLIYTHEIIGTLKESIPLYELLALIVVISLYLSVWIYRWSRDSQKPFIKLAIAGFIAAITIGQLYDSNKFGQGNNRFAHELSKNGPYEFVHAYYHNALDYAQFYKTTESNIALNFVRDKLNASNVTFLNENSIDRNIPSRGSGKPNIIMISVESLSAEYMGHFGNKKNLTPYLDKLADESMLFTNLYATGTRTVRGLEALTTGMPPLPGSSVLRRPNNHGLFTIATPLRANGYEADFIYGGYSYFDNMRAFFSGNGFNVVDRSDIAKEKISFSNAWGVADENLFEKALDVANQHHLLNQKFFSLIMTTSNHRPYNFPEGRVDIKPGTRDAAVKYTDYAIGKFIEDAKKTPWFKDTIFVITADHCASSAGKVQLPVNKYKIPMIVYAPGRINKVVNNSLASQIDIPPTILGMIDINYRSKFFGQDILLNPANRAFISTYQLLGYVKDNKLIVLAPNSEPTGYFLSTDEQNLMSPESSIVHEAVSYYQSAYELLVSGMMKE